MREGFGIFFVNVPLLIFSMLILVLGSWLFQAGRTSTIRAIGGAFLMAVGVLALLNSGYFEGFRWVNELLGVAVVLAIGVGLIIKAPGNITTGVGVIVLVLGVLALSDTYPFDEIKFGNGPVEAFNNGFNELLEILGLRDERNRPNRN